MKRFCLIYNKALSGQPDTKWIAICFIVTWAKTKNWWNRWVSYSSGFVLSWKTLWETRTWRSTLRTGPWKYFVPLPDKDTWLTEISTKLDYSFFENPHLASILNIDIRTRSNLEQNWDILSIFTLFPYLCLSYSQYYSQMNPQFSKGTVPQNVTS